MAFGSRQQADIMHSRGVKAEEAHRLGLVNYLVQTEGTRKLETGESAVMTKALEIARSVSSHPQRCMRNDRLSMLKTSYFPSEHKLMEQEFALGMNTLEDVGFGKQVQAFVVKSRI